MSEQSEAEIDRNPNCEMPDCDGECDGETHAARDPSGELVEMCDYCLDDGWRVVVEVLD